MAVTLIGRKLGSMRLFDGDGRARGVSVIEVEPNRITQLRSPDRDGYSAVQVGYSGPRKRLNRPARGHLRGAGLENEALDVLREFRVDDSGEYELGQELSLELFEPGQFVDVQGTSKGRGFAGGVRRWNFAGGPKTHGQSDRHRAPGSIGAGTTPGRVFKGQKMAGHMGARNVSVLNLLVVQVDPAHNLLFVQGSVPGPRGGLVTVQAGRRAALAEFSPPVLPELEDEEEETPIAPADEVTDAEPEAAGAEAPEAGDDSTDDATDAEDSQGDESDAADAPADDDTDAAESDGDTDGAADGDAAPEAAPDGDADADDADDADDTSDDESESRNAGAQS